MWIKLKYSKTNLFSYAIHPNGSLCVCAMALILRKKIYIYTKCWDIIYWEWFFVCESVAYKINQYYLRVFELTASSDWTILSFCFCFLFQIVSWTMTDFFLIFFSFNFIWFLEQNCYTEMLIRFGKSKRLDTAGFSPRDLCRCCFFYIKIKLKSILAH